MGQRMTTVAVPRPFPNARFNRLKFHYFIEALMQYASTLRGDTPFYFTGRFPAQTEDIRQNVVRHILPDKTELWWMPDSKLAQEVDPFSIMDIFRGSSDEDIWMTSLMFSRTAEHPLEEWRRYPRELLILGSYGSDHVDMLVDRLKRRKVFCTCMIVFDYPTSHVIKELGPIARRAARQNCGLNRGRQQSLFAFEREDDDAVMARLKLDGRIVPRFW